MHKVADRLGRRREINNSQPPLHGQGASAHLEGAHREFHKVMMVNMAREDGGKAPRAQQFGKNLSPPQTVTSRHQGS